jgi:hypothetical protein
MTIDAWILVGALLAAVAPPVPVAPAARATATLDDEAAELAAKLRNPKLAYDERVAIEERLLALGAHGARVLQRHVEERVRRVDERAKRSERIYLSGLERAAKKTIETRLDRAALAEVEKLQKQVNRLRDDAALSKERIRAEGDPARERLAELLHVQVSPALERDAELAAGREALFDDLHELEQDFVLWQRCNAALPEVKRSKAFADPTGRRPGVLDAEDWICTVATPMSDADREVLVKNRALAAELSDPEEAAGVLDLNRLRILLGLHALALDVKLCHAARDHSNDMRTLGFFAHESPVEGKRTPGDRASRAGTSASAENIAGGQTTGAGANSGWWYSPGHHKNMLGGFGRVGLGRSEELWTQMFG